MSARRKKGVDPKLKAKRQKILLAVLGVVFVGLLALELPKTMKILNRKAPAQAAASATTPAPTTPGAPGGSTSLAAAGALVNTDAPPVPQQGQLVSFSRFASKDPFVQQVDATAGAGSYGATPASTAAPAVAASVTPSAAGQTGAGTTTIPSGSKTTGATGGSTSAIGVPPTTPGAPTAGSTTPATPQPAPTTATISVNGIRETVDTGKDFPSDDPVFHLVSVTAAGVKIGIVGGSYSSGAATLTLELGKTVTLQNTADGTEYDIRLISVGAPDAAGTTTTAPQTTSPAATTPAATTPAATTPVSTTTSTTSTTTP